MPGKGSANEAFESLKDPGRLMFESLTAGNVVHVFLNRKNFIWNNRCGDTAVLRTAKGVVDLASYAAQPAEGATLRRAPISNWLR